MPLNRPRVEDVQLHALIVSKPGLDVEFPGVRPRAVARLFSGPGPWPKVGWRSCGGSGSSQMGAWKSGRFNARGPVFPDYRDTAMQVRELPECWTHSLWVAPTRLGSGPCVSRFRI